jgi:hypothetical protein
MTHECDHIPRLCCEESMRCQERRVQCDSFKVTQGSLLITAGQRTVHVLQCILRAITATPRKSCFQGEDGWKHKCCGAGYNRSEGTDRALSIKRAVNTQTTSRIHMTISLEVTTEIAMTVSMNMQGLPMGIASQTPLQVRGPVYNAPSSSWIL